MKLFLALLGLFSIAYSQDLVTGGIIPGLNAQPDVSGIMPGMEALAAPGGSSLSSAMGQIMPGTAAAAGGDIGVPNGMAANSAGSSLIQPSSVMGSMPGGLSDEMPSGSVVENQVVIQNAEPEEEIPSITSTISEAGDEDEQQDEQEDVCSEDFLCIEIFLPVCGSDGLLIQTFDNQCFLEVAQCGNPNLIELHKDACTDDDLATSDFCSEEMFCIEMFDPVCATDGEFVQTFPNECMLMLAQCKDTKLAMKHKGSCTDDDGEIKAANADDLMSEITSSPSILILIIIGLAVLTVGIVIWKKRKPQNVEPYLPLEETEMMGIDF